MLEVKNSGILKNVFKTESDSLIEPPVNWWADDVAQETNS